MTTLCLQDIEGLPALAAEKRCELLRRAHDISTTALGVAANPSAERPDLASVSACSPNVAGTGAFLFTEGGKK